MREINETSAQSRIRFCPIRERRNQPQVEITDAELAHEHFNEEEYWEAQELIEEKERQLK